MDFSSHPFVVEHVWPLAKGGATALENLALACGGCNGHKYTKTKAIDPAGKADVPLFNPRQDEWGIHFGWSQDYTQIIGLTAVGRATVATLRLNRPGVVNIRTLLRQAGLHPPSALLSD